MKTCENCLYSKPFYGGQLQCSYSKSEYYREVMDILDNCSSYKSKKKPPKPTSNIPKAQDEPHEEEIITTKGVPVYIVHYDGRIYGDDNGKHLYFHYEQEVRQYIQKRNKTMKEGYKKFNYIKAYISVR